MTDHELLGADGGTPLGFLAGLGVLAALHEDDSNVRLSWPEGSTTARISCTLPREELLERLADDPQRPVPAWITSLSYPKLEKAGVKSFRGCSAPVPVYRAWVLEALVNLPGSEATNMLASLACPAPGEEIGNERAPNESHLAQYGAVDFRGANRRTHSSFFDFTSRNTQFLDQARLIGERVSVEAVENELFAAKFANLGTRRMGWDPWFTRPAALSSASAIPAAPVLEWFAFRSLAAFPMVPLRGGAISTACSGQRKRGALTWPLWREPLAWTEARTLINLTLSEDWTESEKRARGVRDVFRAQLAKAADGYSGMFSPAEPLSSR